MTFAQSMDAVSLENGHILCANCQADAGYWEDSKMDLDECIGNEDGCFKWNGVNFSGSAQ